jgi:hypothetical protein
MLRSLLQVMLVWVAVSMGGGFLWILLSYLVPKWHKVKVVQSGGATSEAGRQLGLPY